MREIEILFEVTEPREEALRKLQQFTYTGTAHLHDLYFSHPALPKLAPKGYELLESFRLRTKEGQAILTWKHAHMQEDVFLYADEEEAKVESAEDTERLLRALGFEELVRIDNERATFHTKDYEIVLEQVRDLGLLLEVEAKNPLDRDAMIIRDEIRAFLRSTGLAIGEEFQLGKPELMLRRK